MDNIGVQTTTRYALWPSQIRFIDRSRALEVVINEGISMFTVRYYMAILVQDSMQMELVFPVGLAEKP